MEKSANTIGRKKFGKLSVRGRHKLLAQLAAQALASGETDAFFERYQELQSWADSDRYTPPSRLSPLEAIEETRLFHEELIGGTVSPDSQKKGPTWEPKFQVEIVLDQVRSPYNVGSALRLADNFGFAGVTHSTAGLRSNHPRLIKAARGCERWIPLRFEEDLETWLKNAGVPVIGVELDKTAIPITQWQAPLPCILLMGNESYGIASSLRQLCSQLVYIPMYGFKKSMNVNQALAVMGQTLCAQQG